MVLRNKKLFIRGLLIGLLFFAFLFGTVALAEDIQFKPNVPIPGADNINTLPEYIAALYKFLVGIAGILAVVMITFGGLLWLFSGGSPDKISKAKEIIFGAVIGLIIALSSYLILNTISPSLVKFKLFVPPVRTLDISSEYCNTIKFGELGAERFYGNCGEKFNLNIRGLEDQKGCIFTKCSGNKVCVNDGGSHYCTDKIKLSFKDNTHPEWLLANWEVEKKSDSGATCGKLAHPANALDKFYISNYCGDKHCVIDKLKIIDLDLGLSTPIAESPPANKTTGFAGWFTYDLGKCH